MKTCYKVFRREVLAGIQPRSNRFCFEPEITAKVAKGKWRVYGVPISYFGRSYDEGKKITWRNGVQALWQILRYNLFDRNVVSCLLVGCLCLVTARPTAETLPDGEPVM